MVSFKGYVSKIRRRAEDIESLFDLKELTLSFDNLNKENTVEKELMYFKTDKGDEKTGIFIFGFDYFIRELSEQEFKRILGQNSLNYQIRAVYNKLSSKKKKVKVTDIIHKLQFEKSDSKQIHEILTRILTLGYYLNWKLERDKKDIEGDYFIEISDGFLQRLKQRYNFEVFSSVYENETFFIFLNARGKLNMVFKNKDQFNKNDIKKNLKVGLQKSFNIKKLVFEN